MAIQAEVIGPSIQGNKLGLGEKSFQIFNIKDINNNRFFGWNEIREFWYEKRPDILNYLQKAYKDLDIQFLPDSVVTKLSQEKLITSIDSLNQSVISLPNSFADSPYTELVSTENLIQAKSILLNSEILNHFQFLMDIIEKGI